jgi:hypothetical protein
MVISQGAMIEVDDKLFDEKEWIGRGKKYDWATLPGYVTSAKNISLEIPEIFAHQAQLPQPNLPITDFISFKLPQLSVTVIRNYFQQDKHLV